jgi:hypothetical protein
VEHRITFLIGNGFDLQVGLKTRYIDFYNIYKVIANDDNELIKWFKNQITKDEGHGWINWSDFEIHMGEASSNFANAGDFKSCLNDFVIKFNNYLKSECSSIDWKAINSDTYIKFCNSFNMFGDHMSENGKGKFYKLMDNASGSVVSIDFLQFNYTDIFDKMLSHFRTTLIENVSSNSRNSVFSNQYRIGRCGYNLHIHNRIDHHPIIGVDHAKQIKNRKIRNDKSVSTVFIKRNFLNTIQIKENSQTATESIAYNLIKNSKLICLFGTSIGATDTRWWKVIGDTIKSSKSHDVTLFIFDICGEIDDGISIIRFSNSLKNAEEKRNKILNNFYKYAEWNEEDQQKYGENIVVELDCKLFDFKLPRV